MQRIPDTSLDNIISNAAAEEGCRDGLYERSIVAAEKLAEIGQANPRLSLSVEVELDLTGGRGRPHPVDAPLLLLRAKRQQRRQR